MNLDSCEEKIGKFKKIFEDRTFTEKDIRSFLKLFAQSKDYKTLAKFSDVSKHVAKYDIKTLFKFDELKGSDKKIEIVSFDKAFPDFLYLRMALDLVHFGEKYDIKMENQTIKEIIACIFSSVQFSYAGQNRRYCSIKYNDSFALGSLCENKVVPLSLIEHNPVEEDSHYENVFFYGLISTKRIDGKLMIVDSKDDVLFTI